MMRSSTELIVKYSAMMVPMLIILLMVNININVAAAAAVAAGDGNELTTWCIAKPESTEAQYRAAIEYVCGTEKLDCSPVNPGGVCYEQPNDAELQASFVMNRYYVSNGRNSWNCDFSGIGIVVETDPSYGYCEYDR